MESSKKIQIGQVDVSSLENVTNKATNLTSPDNTKYPTTQAVVNGLATKQTGSTKVLASAITTTSTSAVNTNLSFPIGANETLKFVVDIQGTTSTGGIFYQPTVPSGATVVGGLITTNTISTSSRFLGLVANTLTAVATSTSAGAFISQLAFTVINGSTSGNVILSFASGTGNSTTIDAGSSMHCFSTQSV